MRLNKNRIGVNVHYIPVYYHPFYKNNLKVKPKCPQAEKVYEQILSIPIFPGLQEFDLEHITTTINSLVKNV